MPNPAQRPSLWLLLLALATLTACASAPDPVPTPPIPGPYPQLQPAPPIPTRTPLLTGSAAPAPELPEARRQEVNEVFADQHDVVGAPEDFALQPKELVVVALPEELGMEAPEMKRTRVQMATAFLSQGHQTKDAGRYRETTFRTNAWPDGDDRKQVSETVRTGEEGTSEVVTRTTSSSKPWYWDSWYAWRNERGLRLDLRDPTSLWITHLGKYDAIKSRYFLRVFDLRFATAHTEIKLVNKVAAGDVTAYRQALAAHNEAIDQYGNDRSRFLIQTRRYADDYERSKRTNEQALENYKRTFATEWAAYEQQFAAWQLRNPDSLEQLAEPPTLRLPTAMAAKQTFATPPPREKVSDDALIALLQNEVEADVPVTTLMVLAEVVDTKTGEVAWAGEFTGYTRTGVGDRVRLLETFIEQALH